MTDEETNGNSAPDKNGPTPEVSDRLRWALLIPCMLLPVLGTYLYFDLWHGTTSAMVFYQITKAFTILFPIICALWILKTGLPFRTHPAKHHFRAIPAGVILGLAIVGLALLLLKTPLGPIVDESGKQIREHLEGTPWLKYFFPVAIAISLIHSFVEEFFWRWFVYGQLLRPLFSRPVALVLGGIGFSLHHIVVLLQFFPVPIALAFSACVGLGGVFWSILLDRQNSLAGAWASHMVADFGMLGIGYWLMFY